MDRPAFYLPSQSVGCFSLLISFPAVISDYLGTTHAGQPVSHICIGSSLGNLPTHHNAPSIDTISHSVMTGKPEASKSCTVAEDFLSSGRSPADF